MNFGENLQILRKSNNISQEQLAERLNVSRQAVSKWETDGGYPEIDKLVAICEIFGCSVDELLTGKISVDKANERRRHERHYGRFAKLIATGVALILAGVSLTVLLSGNGANELLNTVGSCVMFTFVAAAVMLFIVGGLEHSDYVRSNPTLPQFYTPEEVSHFNTRVLPYYIAGGIMLIFVGLIATIFSSLVRLENIGAATFLALIGVACWLFIYGGITHSKYNTEAYNRERRLQAPPSEHDTEKELEIKNRHLLIGKICGTIMLTATAIYLAGGFIFNIWSPTWAVFPIGGILCGIVSTILGPHVND